MLDMKEDVRSIQLSVRGKPSAFDLNHGGGMAVVASPGCMTFFDLDGLGVPRHYIYYEQQTQVRRIRYQKEGLLAALRGGAVSVWDPSQSLRPLLGFIQGNDWITNLEWGLHNANLIATCSDGGDGKIFDARAPNLPMQTINVGGICQKISWSKYDSNLLAISNEKKVAIYDNRMIGSHNVVTSHDVPDGIIQFTWCAKENQALIIASRDGHLTWLTSIGDPSGEREVKQGGLVDDASLLFSTPVGMGAIVCRYEYMGSTKQAQPFLDSVPKEPNMQEPLVHVSGAKRAVKHDGGGGLRSDSRKVVVNLIGYPDVESKEQSDSPRNRVQLAQCPDPIVGVRWGKPGRLIPPMHNGQEMLFLSTSSCLHAVAIPVEKINRYCSLASGGSTRKLGAHHDPESALFTGKRTEDTNGLERKDQPLMRLNPPKFSISGLKRYIVPCGPSGLPTENHTISSSNTQLSGIKTDEATGAGTVLSLSGEYWTKLQDSVLLLQKRVQGGYLEGLSIDLVDKYARQITLYLERPDSAPFSSISASHAKTFAQSGNSDKAVHSGSAFSDFAAISSVDVNIDATATSTLPDITNETVTSNTGKRLIDENDMSWSPKKSRKSSIGTDGKAVVGNLSGLSEKEKRINDRADRIERSKAKNAALIISFPPNYPQNGYPTFTLRSGGLASSSSSLRSDIIAELTSIAKGSTLGVKVNVDGDEVKEELTPTKLIFDVAECFRCRTLQYWGVKVNMPPPKAAASAPTSFACHVSFQSSDFSASNQADLSPTRLKRSSGSYGDIGLDIDGSPVDVLNSQIEEVLEVLGTEVSSLEDKSSINESSKSSNEIPSEKEQRRRIAGDGMFDEEVVDIEKTDKDGEDAPVETGISYSKATEVIDPMAYYVPCPASSGGVFAPSGALMAFGGAKFVIKLIPKQKVQVNCSPVAASEQNDVCSTAVASADKDILPGNKFLNNMYPKSYADMLLRQREREFYESELIAEDERWKLNKSVDDINTVKNIVVGDNAAQRPIVKSSSGVFFVDQNLNSDISGSEVESTEDESPESAPDDSSTSASDESDSDYGLKEIDQSPSISGRDNISYSLYSNPLLLGATMDMEALSAHLDEEQLFLRRNGSGGSISSAVDLSSLDVLNGDISNSADARRKRFLVAEALQVSSKNPTMVEIFSRGFEMYQNLSDLYDLGPTSLKACNEESSSQMLSYNQDVTHSSAWKFPNALFAHLRSEVEGATRLRNRDVDDSRDTLDVSLPRGLVPISRNIPSNVYGDSSIAMRMRSSSSYNDLLVEDTDGFYENSHSKSVDKDNHMVQSILFPAEIQPAGADTGHLRSVSWGRDIPGSTKVNETDGHSSVGSQSNKTEYQKRIQSNGINSIRQLHYSAAELNDSETHKTEMSSDESDEYRADDRIFRKNIDIGWSNSNKAPAVKFDKVQVHPAAMITGTISDDDARIDPIIRDYRLPMILHRKDTCLYNAKAAASVGNVDASQLWDLLSISLGTMAITVPLTQEDVKLISISPSSSCDFLVTRGLQTSWQDSALGLLLMKRVLNLCEQTGGVQTLATIICVLGGPSHVAVLLAGNHPYFSSCSPKSRCVPVESSVELLKLQVQYNGVLSSYCNALYSWRKFITCTEISRRIAFLNVNAADNFLPHVWSQASLSSALSTDSGKEKEVSKDDEWGEKGLLIRKAANPSVIEIALKCPTCINRPLENAWCQQCCAFPIRCGVCQEGIRGAAVYCPQCMHGGHLDHIRQWFEQMEQLYCPTGCGCECSSMLKVTAEEADTSESDCDDSLSDHSGPSRIFRSSYSESSAAGDSSDSDEEERVSSAMRHRSGHQKLFQRR